MLNPFPQLLVYGFFAPTLLRLGAACVFFYLARFHMQHRKETAQELSILSYETAVLATGLFILVELLVALGLLLGFYTQVAAILGVIICLKVLLVKRGLRHVSPLSHLGYALLALICLSLLFTGAGAFAFDLPL